jgi:peroxiredoxin
MQRLGYYLSGFLPLEIRMARWVFALVLAFVPAATFAGEFNPTLSIGDAAPAWSHLPGVEGKRHSLSDLKDKRLVVVVFTCKSCPVAVDYEDRISDLARRHAPDLAVVAICVSQAEEDSFDNLKNAAKEKKFPFPVLSDPSQKIGRDYGASGTPEFFLLSPERKVIYMGAMDDNSNSADVKEHYLEAAVEAALAGKAPAIQETYAHGCRIRYARQRK